MPQQWKDQLHITATPQPEQLLTIKQKSHPGCHCSGKSVPLRAWYFIPMQVFDQLKKIMTFKAPNHWIPCAFPVHAVTYSKLDSLDWRNCSHFSSKSDLLHSTTLVSYLQKLTSFILSINKICEHLSHSHTYFKLLPRYHLIPHRGCM